MYQQYKKILPKYRRAIGEPHSQQALYKTTEVLFLANNNLGTRDVRYNRDADGQTNLLTRITQGDAASQRRTREIFVKGFRLNYHYSAVDNLNSIVNFAIICVSNDVSFVDDVLPKLLREYGASGQRSIDPNASATGGVRRSMRPMNDDEFEILAHKRFMLSGNADTSVYRENKVGSMYIPLNKVMTYEDSTAVSCNDQIYHIAWATIPNQIQAQVAAPLVQYSLDCQCIWKES